MVSPMLIKKIPLKKNNISNNKKFLLLYLLIQARIYYFLGLPGLYLTGEGADLCSNTELKFNMYPWLRAFSMDISNGLLPFYNHHPLSLSAYCLSFSFSPPPPPSLALFLPLIAVPLMPPAQSQPRPAVGPQRFPVSSSCSSTSLSPHFLSSFTRLASLLVRAISLLQLDCLPRPNTVKANL